MLASVILIVAGFLSIAAFIVGYWLMSYLDLQRLDRTIEAIQKKNDQDLAELKAAIEAEQERLAKKGDHYVL